MAKTNWFIYCGDAHSNEVVAEALRGLQAVDDFSEHECADGMKRPLYRARDYSLANRLARSQKDLQASLKIFRSQGNGKPTEWKFQARRKPTLGSLKEKSDAIKKRATAIHQRSHR